MKIKKILALAVALTSVLQLQVAAPQATAVQRYQQ